jgi:opacity protein-like surface antigen
LRHTNLLKTKLAALMIVAVCAALIAPAFAAAQTVDPTASQYNNTLQQVSQGGSSCTEGSSGSGSSGTGAGGSSDCAPPPSANAGLGGNVGPLPFTGFDVIAMAAVALAVTGLGLGLQRAVSRDETA